MPAYMATTDGCIPIPTTRPTNSKQGTACIYSRKVEYLHTLVFQVRACEMRSLMFI